MRQKYVDHKDEELVYYKIGRETWKDTAKRINWVSSAMLILTPLMTIWAIFYVEMTKLTLLWTILWYFCTGFGITAGYHRLWSHRCYNAVWPVRLILMWWGSGAAQGSIRWWSRNHRIHHRYTDTPLDPYNSRQGFFYSHFGWMLVTKDYSKLPTPKFDIEDLEDDWVVMFQNKYYGILTLGASFLFPTLVAGLGWGDYWGGFFYAGVARQVFVHHATFCVNSLAHWLGEQPFANENTPRDHWVTALLTLGEGYHNFHHEFASDYRNAVKWWQYDPTKWLILVLYYLGLAYDLKKFGSNEIKLGQFQIKQKVLNTKKGNYNWGPSAEDLPSMTMSEFKQKCKNGEKLIVISSFVHDIEKWIPEHPGGKIIAQYIGTDATEAFNGEVYRHSESARRLRDLTRVATISKTPAKRSRSPRKLRNRSRSRTKKSRRSRSRGSRP